MKLKDEWEMSNLGNYNRIYPSEDAERNEVYLKVIAASGSTAQTEAQKRKQQEETNVNKVDIGEQSPTSPKKKSSPLKKKRSFVMAQISQHQS